MKDNIVISGINLVDGGTFTIIKECLDSLEISDLSYRYNIIALVHKKELFPQYKHIFFIEFPKSKKSYFLRLYYEYFHFRSLSQKYKPKLWLSLHDISPRVIAETQAVYMHNPSPFLGRPKRFSLRGIGFSSFYKYIYRINIFANSYLIVQQQWLREAFSKMFSYPQSKIIVAAPERKQVNMVQTSNYRVDDAFTFIYPSYPRDFKNFEVICEAVKLLNSKGTKRKYRVLITIDGSENEYSQKIFNRFKGVENLFFIGLINKTDMSLFYENSDCLIFPSKMETWGLPISEYINYKKPMIVSDLPYAHETSSGAESVAFFNPTNPDELSLIMFELVNNDKKRFNPVAPLVYENPVATSWEYLFNYLLGIANE